MRFPGPNGLAQEIFTKAKSSAAPLDMQVGGFVTGESGMGHVAITSKKPHQMRGYYDTVFDARLSDFIVAADIASGRLCEVLGQCRSDHVPISLLFPPSRQASPPVRAFIDWVTALFASRGS